MKTIASLSIFLLAGSLSCADSHLDSYFEYLNTYSATLGPWGDAANGEIEIIRDIEKITEIEQMAGRQVGIIAKDKYFIWINDAVQFPNGKYGVYGRILWVASLQRSSGVAVMPILPDGKIALNRNFRHATRSWEYELPRGTINADETIHAAAVREVKEETGMEIDELHLLGNMAVDSGFTNSVIPIFLAKVLSLGESECEDSEAIAAIEPFTVEELKQGLVSGYLTATVDGKPCQVHLRDPFLAFAILQAELQSLLTRRDGL
jgi:ADP-ribose pyrophosphatase